MLTGIGAWADDYTFNCKDWVTMDTGRVIQDSIYYDEGANTITVNAGTGANNVALANGSQETVTTSSLTVTKDRNWFIVVATHVSTGTSASQLWFMNGYNNGMTEAPTKVVELSGVQMLLAWDLSEGVAGTNLTEEENSLNGWTGFGLTSTTGSSVISDINFYTWTAAVEKYPALANETAETTPYEFVCAEWVASDDGRALQSNISYDEDANTITVAATGANNMALGNHPSKAWGTEYFDDITTAHMYITKDQCWFVIAGSDLSTGSTDSYWWWMNGYNNAGQVAPDKVVEHNGQQVFAWDISQHMGTADVDGKIMLDGGTCFGLTSTSTSSTLSDICFYTWEAAVSAYPELNDGNVHTCVATESHWTIDPVTPDGGTLQQDTWGTQDGDESGMEPPFMEYYVYEGEDGDVTLSSATISHTQLTDLAKGYYEVSMDIRIIDYDTDATVGEGTLFIANDASEDLTATDGNEVNYGGHDEVYGRYTLICEVTEAGTLDISIKLPDSPTYNWLTWKNLEVNYVGDTKVEWTLRVQYGTMILPFDYDLPRGLTAYTITGLNADGDELELSTEGLSSIKANTPYIMSGEAEAQTTYTFIDDAVEATSLTDGYLTGILAETTAPSGSYVLQNQTGTPAFYLVNSEDITVGAYHCYLTLPDTGGEAKAVVYFPGSGVATAIEAVETAAVDGITTDNEAIYDLSGRKVTDLRSGIYIKDGKKVVIK